MATDQHTQRRERSTDSTNDGTPAADHAHVPALIAEEYTLQFAGLVDGDAEAVLGPDDRSPEVWCGDDSVTPLEQAIAVLPRASSGELRATSEFVATDGAVDVSAVESVHGLDTDTIERATGRSLDQLAVKTDAEPIVPVDDHQDIVDRRRKALCALGYDVRFRWQIVSDRYSIINPQEAYQPIITALQRRDERDAFGWLSYRDWGGLLKMFVVCPGLRREIDPPDEPIDIDDEADCDVLGSHPGSERKNDNSSDEGKEELVVYGGYDFRGTQTLWAKPILYFPDSETIVPDTGQRYTRRHYGQATDADHERVPISEW